MYVIKSRKGELLQAAPDNPYRFKSKSEARRHLASLAPETAETHKFEVVEEATDNGKSK